MNPFNLNELYLYHKLKELNGDDEWEVLSKPGIMRACQNTMIDGKVETKIVEYTLRTHKILGKKKWFVSQFVPRDDLQFKLPMPFYDLEIEDEK